MVEDYLFSPDLLDVDLDASSAKFNPKLTIKNPGEGLLLRPLSREDYDRGFLQLLSELTSVGNISRDQWDDRFDQMKNAQGTYFVAVIEDTTLNKACMLVFNNANANYLNASGDWGHNPRG